MAEALIAGAALGAPFGELHKAVIAVAKKTAKFKFILKRLESTLKSLHPMVLEIAKLDKQLLDHSNQETIVFIAQLEQGITLIRTCASIQCGNLYSKSVTPINLSNWNLPYQLSLELRRRPSWVVLAGRLWLGFRIWSPKLIGYFPFVSNQAGFSGLCSVPELPDLVIGLDVQVAVLKGMLLKDDVSVVVLSAPRGCGKTTLAKMLCHDYEIRARFGVQALSWFKRRMCS